MDPCRLDRPPAASARPGLSRIVFRGLDIETATVTVQLNHGQLTGLDVIIQ